jgi:hypothetical protein
MPALSISEKSLTGEVPSIAMVNNPQAGWMLDNVAGG